MTAEQASGRRAEKDGCGCGGVSPPDQSNKSASVSEMMQIRAEAAALGLTPLQVLLHIMRIYFQAEDWDKAAENAARAAPFMHAKLISSQVTVRRPDEMTDDELLSSIAIDRAEYARLQGEAAPDARGSVSGGADETRH